MMLDGKLKDLQNNNNSTWGEYDLALGLGHYLGDEVEKNRTLWLLASIFIVVLIWLA